MDRLHACTSPPVCASASARIQEIQSPFVVPVSFGAVRREIAHWGQDYAPTYHCQSRDTVYRERVAEDVVH